jgi:hypothetical protein
MHVRDKRLIALAIPALLALGIAAPHAAGEIAQQPIQCGIETKSENGMAGFRGRVHVAADVSGTYTLVVGSAGASGRSDISQGGTFSAKAGDEVHLGQVMLSDNGQYEVDFEVTANGHTYDCNGSAPREN